MHLLIQLSERDDFFEIAATTDRSQVATMVLQPGQNSGEFGNDHPDSDQILHVISGTGRAKVEEHDVELNPGDTLVIASGERHQIIGTGASPLRTLNVYAPVAYPIGQS